MGLPRNRCRSNLEELSFHWRNSERQTGERDRKRTLCAFVIAYPRRRDEFLLRDFSSPPYPVAAIMALLTVSFLARYTTVSLFFMYVHICMARAMPTTMRFDVDIFAESNRALRERDSSK